MIEVTIDMPDVEIIEEVPGVHYTEAFFIRHKGKLHHFAKLSQAKKWCRDNNLTFKFIPFEP